MMAQVSRGFTDLEEGVYRATGELFEAADERVAHLASLGLVVPVGGAARQQRKRAARKRD